MSISDTFYLWAYKGRQFVNPEKALRFFLVVYFLMYLFNTGSTIREPLFIAGISITGILHYVGKFIKNIIVTGDKQVKEAFQREVQWEGEMQSTRKRLYQYMHPHMSWCDEFTLTWADGHWLVYARWSSSETSVEERQVDGWPFFKHIIVCGRMDSSSFKKLPEYYPKTRIFNSRLS